MKKAIAALAVIAALIVAILMFSSRFTVAEHIYVEWQGNSVSIRGKGAGGLRWQSKRGMLSMTANKSVGKSLKLHLTGQSSNGQLEFTANNKTEVILEGIKLSNAQGAALVFKGSKSTLLTLKDSTINVLGDAGIEVKDDLIIAGNGTLTIEARGTGHKGIKIGGDLEVTDNPTITIITTGQPAGKTAMAPPAYAPGFNGNSDEGLPPLPEGFVRYDYSGTTKAIKVKGDINIYGGIITLRTSTPGAEGLEAKGDLTIDGGIVNVEAYDDAINVGMTMRVNGGEISATGTHNDGIDVNGGRPKAWAMTPDASSDKSYLDDSPTYIQTGGKVVARTTAGLPEEGLDTDNVPISHTGGELIIEPQTNEMP